MMRRITRNSLHSVTEKGHINAVKKLLYRGADVNSVDNIKRTALHIAAFKGEDKIVKLLLKKKADISCEDLEGHTALHLAAKHGHIHIVKILFAAQRADVNLRTPRIEPLIHLASLNGHLHLVKYLIRRGFKIDAKDQYGATALHIASAAGYVKVVKELLKCGAGVNEIAQCEMLRPFHSLHCAILGKDYLKKRNSVLERIRQTKQMTTAETENRLQIIDELLNAGAELNNFKEFATPLHLSVHFSFSKRLIDRGAEIDVVDHRGMTALHCASKNNCPKIVQLLLEAGANVDVRVSKWELTSLHFATIFKCEKVASMLINAGADVNAQMSSGIPTILIFNYWKRNSKSIFSLFHLLIESGVDMNAALSRKLEATTILNEFLMKDYDNDTYACLFDRFLDLNAGDRYGITPLGKNVLLSNEATLSNPTKFIIKLIVKMESANKFKINEANSKLIANRCFELYNIYKEEIEVLKKTKIWGPITFYDLLVKPLKTLTEYSCNIKIIRILNSKVCSKFPSYGGLIESRMRLAHGRKLLLEKCLISFNKLVSPIILPRFVALNVLSNLSLSNLQILCLV